MWKINHKIKNKKIHSKQNFEIIFFTVMIIMKRIVDAANTFHIY